MSSGRGGPGRPPGKKFSNYSRLNFLSKKVFNPAPKPEEKKLPSPSASPKMNSRGGGSERPPKRKFTNYSRLNHLSKKLFNPAPKTEKKKFSPVAQVEEDIIEINDPQPDPSEPIDYNVPDRSKGDYFCRACECHINTMQVWQSHIVGKRHAKNLEKGPAGLPSKQKFESRPDLVPMILERVNKLTLPVVGLSHVTEFRRANATDPTYTCFLCQGTQPLSQFVAHLITTKHRLNYIKQIDPEGDQTISGLRLRGDALDQVVAEHASVLEQKHGRGKIEVKVERKSDKTKRVYWSAKKKKDPENFLSFDDSRSRSPLLRERSPSPYYRRSRSRSPSPRSRYHEAPSRSAREMSPRFRRELSPDYGRGGSPTAYRRSLSPRSENNRTVYDKREIDDDRIRGEDHRSQLEASYSREDYLKRINDESRSSRLPVSSFEPAYGSSTYTLPKEDSQNSLDYGYRRNELQSHSAAAMPQYTETPQYQYQGQVPVPFYQAQQPLPPPQSYAYPNYPPSVSNTIQGPEYMSEITAPAYGTHLHDALGSSHAVNPQSVPTSSKIPVIENPLWGITKSSSDEKDVLEMFQLYKWATSTQSALQKPKTTLERLEDLSSFDKWCTLLGVTRRYVAQISEIQPLLQLFIQLNKSALEYALEHVSPETQMGITLKLMRENVESKIHMEKKHEVPKTVSGLGAFEAGGSSSTQSMRNFLETPRWLSLSDARKKTVTASNVQATWTKLSQMGQFSQQEKETGHASSKSESKRNGQESKIPRAYQLVSYNDDENDSGSSSSSDLPRSKPPQKANYFSSRYGR